MESVRTIWADIARDLKQNGSDLEIPDKQGEYWTLVTADRMRMQHIVKRRSGAFRRSFVLPVLPDETRPNRYYVALPKSIYDIDLDGGIESLFYWTADECGQGYRMATFFRTDPSRFDTRRRSFYEQATREHPYFMRTGERLYLIGQDSDLEYVEANIYANLPDINDVDRNAPLDFPRELIGVLKQEVLALGRFALALPGQHLTNDGTNRPAEQVALAPQTSSVNDPYSNNAND
jgi:hypothetical protein